MQNSHSGCLKASPTRNEMSETWGKGLIGSVPNISGYSASIFTLYPKSVFFFEHPLH